MTSADLLFPSDPLYALGLGSMSFIKGKERKNT
jgi:hypothetical protein